MDADKQLQMLLWPLTTCFDICYMIYESRFMLLIVLS
jgi:hypothetical protein